MMTTVIQSFGLAMIAFALFCFYKTLHRSKVGWIRTLLEADPNAIYARCYRGMLLAIRGELRKAEEDFSEVQKRSPNYRYLHFWKTVLFLVQNRKDEAVASMNKALEISPMLAHDLDNMPLLKLLRDDPNIKWPANFKRAK
jgi:tetratricopeptide (TPR) repeat protein